MCLRDAREQQRWQALDAWQQLDARSLPAHGFWLFHRRLHFAAGSREGAQMQVRCTRAGPLGKKLLDRHIRGPLPDQCVECHHSPRRHPMEGRGTDQGQRLPTHRCRGTGLSHSAAPSRLQPHPALRSGGAGCEGSALVQHASWDYSDVCCLHAPVRPRALAHCGQESAHRHVIYQSCLWLARDDYHDVTGRRDVGLGPLYVLRSHSSLWFSGGNCLLRQQPRLPGSSELHRTPRADPGLRRATKG
mmetsp:Transcript_71128/g.166513  ORF Transcript_71128/g.166513 Transcript_71128/m.166513 type:complete len:246 (+) Transcript_71128:639-1376(+)